MRFGLRILRGFVAGAAAILLSQGAHACTLTADVTATLSPYSPAAVKAGAVPAVPSRAGLMCDTAVLVLLSDNAIKAKFHSENGLTLKQQSGSATVDYAASVDPSGTYAFGQDTTINYMQNNLLNLLGLLGGSSADLPIYVKPKATATLPPVGVYTDRITIDWDWKMCTGIGALGLCIGILDQGVGRSTITVTLNVTPQNMTMTVTSATTWDPISGTLNPKAFPGSKRRQSLTVNNPDIVAVDTGTVQLVLPTPTGTMVALDGDGTGIGAAIRLADGAPASGMALSYVGPGDSGDDVDFSSDGGASWAYAPAAGNAASQRAITHVRLRPRGAMAKQSNFTVSLPYQVR
jgi:hypothetical protein